MSDKVPLSLQRQCFFYVVHHLEEFPTEILGLLPLRIREELLLTLAPADIFQLEGSKATEGVDMKSVWEAMKKRFAGLDDLKWRNCAEDPREDIRVTVAGYLLFHRSGVWVGRNPEFRQFIAFNRLSEVSFLFFSVWTPPRRSSSAHTAYAFCPDRYARFCSGSDSQAVTRDTAAFLLHRCQVTPLKCLFCNVQHFDLGRVSPEMMQVLFRDLEEVHFYQFGFWYAPSKHTMQVFSSVLRAALTHSSAGLHTLTLSDLPHPFAHPIGNLDTGKVMATAAELFSQARARGHSGLQCLHISLSNMRHRSKIEQRITADVLFASEQLKILLGMFQNSLQDLYLNRWWSSHNQHGKACHNKPLSQSISSLIRMPQFAKLSLENNSLTMEFVHQLLSTFLQSPCQELHMGRNTLLDTAITASMPTLGRIEMAEDACKFKSLDLHAESIEIAESLACFLQGVHKLRLKSLKMPCPIVIECIAHHKDVVVGPDH